MEIQLNCLRMRMATLVANARRKSSVPLSTATQQSTKHKTKKNGKINYRMNGLNSARIFMCTWEFSVWTTIIGYVCVIHDSRRFIFLVRGRFWWNIFFRNFPWEIQSFFTLIIVFFLVKCESVVHCICYLVNLKFEKQINWIKNHLSIFCGWILFLKK